MFTREDDKVVCRKFNAVGIYRAITGLKDDTVVHCTEEVIRDFEAFAAGNVRIRRAVGLKNITLEKLQKKRKRAVKETRKRED